jgi:hypothetical protein
MQYHDVCFLGCEVYTDFGRAMMFRVESPRDQCSVGVDTVSKKREIENFKNLQIESGWWIQVLKHVTDLIRSDLHPQFFFFFFEITDRWFACLLIAIASNCLRLKYRS